MTQTLLTAIIIILVVILLLVAALLVLRAKLIPQGNVKITINDDKEMTVPTGGTLISTLSEQGVHLPSACGGSAPSANRASTCPRPAAARVRAASASVASSRVAAASCLPRHPTSAASRYRKAGDSAAK